MLNHGVKMPQYVPLICPSWARKDLINYPLHPEAFVKYFHELQTRRREIDDLRKKILEVRGQDGSDQISKQISKLEKEFSDLKIKQMTPDSGQVKPDIIEPSTKASPKPSPKFAVATIAVVSKFASEIEISTNLPPKPPKFAAAPIEVIISSPLNSVEAAVTPSVAKEAQFSTPLSKVAQLEVQYSFSHHDLTGRDHMAIFDYIRDNLALLSDSIFIDSEVFGAAYHHSPSKNEFPIPYEQDDFATWWSFPKGVAFMNPEGVAFMNPEEVPNEKLPAEWLRAVPNEKLPAAKPKPSTGILRNYRAVYRWAQMVSPVLVFVVIVIFCA